MLSDVTKSWTWTEADFLKWRLSFLSLPGHQNGKQRNGISPCVKSSSQMLARKWGKRDFHVSASSSECGNTPLPSASWCLTILLRTKWNTDCECSVRCWLFCRCPQTTVTQGVWWLERSPQSWTSLPSHSRGDCSAHSIWGTHLSYFFMR